MKQLHKMSKSILILLVCHQLSAVAQETPGAEIPWITYEAENMKTTGTVLGPKYEAFQVETESSGQKCVKLSANDQYIEFTVKSPANAIVLRYSLPDAPQGGGTSATLGLYVNGKLLKKIKISSVNTMLYGTYPFTNDPTAGKPRNFYDETRLKGLAFKKGDVIKIQREPQETDKAEYCIIDLVDLENADAPLTMPDKALPVTDKTFMRDDFTGDFTEAFRRCIAKAAETGQTVWIPAGTYKITGDIKLPSKIKIQGAGIWHTVIMGDENVYGNAKKRVRFLGDGDSIQLADFAIVGKLNYRNDEEPNDAIVGSYGVNSKISRIWIEHTKIGIWVENSKNLVIEGCRFRNTIADGINFCVGMRESTMKNCTARGTGDDCFAMWPTTFIEQKYNPGKNLITHCTGQLPFLANGAAIYGGESNRVEYCSFIDICPGSAILISTTFPTEDKIKNINNNFTGTTVIEHCSIKTSGGFDHTWDWRAAVQLCLDKRDITGVEMNDLAIENSFSDGLSVIANNDKDKFGTLSNVVLKNSKIGKYGIGAKDKHGLWIQKGAHGSLTIENSQISEMKNESGDFTIKK
ncbi:MAG TPA: glycosyl hydrolase family 28-related protein [Cytophagaceae bacterium]|nr:glycosyl hydrolase family 28-related protein [Cytophagaceae bacterium]